MTETPQPTETGNQEPAKTPPVRPEVPRGKIWLFGGLFLIVAFGMYAGTMYRIKTYGYVGIGADQPIKPGVQLTK